MRTNKRLICKRIRAANPGISCRYDSATEEYRVTFTAMNAAEREAHAYYTNDADDAAGTARSMWNLRVKAGQ